MQYMLIASDGTKLPEDHTVLRLICYSADNEVLGQSRATGSVQNKEYC